jgi:hypothetical protein
MGMFGKFLKKLGFGDDKAESAAPAQSPVAASPASSQAAQPAGSAPAAATGGAATAPRAAAMSSVDVVAKLESLSAANSQKLNWRTSIVDLMKLLDLDSSLAARKDLATELGCPADLMGDSAKMNVWLHKTVLRKLAENGGNVPKELL